MRHLDLTPVLDVLCLSTVLVRAFLFLTTSLQHDSDQWCTATAADRSTSPLRTSPLGMRSDPSTCSKLIGKGSLGKVMQVRGQDSQLQVKMLRKANVANRPVETTHTHILAERTVLVLVNNPFVIPLEFSFQNPDEVYLVMSYGSLPGTK